MCMDQVVETECTQDAADSDEEAHEDKEPVMGGDPEDAPKKYTEKADLQSTATLVIILKYMVILLCDNFIATLQIREADCVI